MRADVGPESQRAQATRMLLHQHTSSRLSNRSPAIYPWSMALRSIFCTGAVTCAGRPYRVQDGTDWIVRPLGPSRPLNAQRTGKPLHSSGLARSPLQHRAARLPHVCILRKTRALDTNVTESLP